eukprot:9779537-Ditylum_brightwellii.AAC.1
MEIITTRLEIILMRLEIIMTKRKITTTRMEITMTGLKIIMTRLEIISFIEVKTDARVICDNTNYGCHPVAQDCSEAGRLLPSDRIIDSDSRAHKRKMYKEGGK